MNILLLERLEKNPSALFAESQLEKWGPAEFHDLQERQLITRLSGPNIGDSYVDVHAQRLVTVAAAPDGLLEAIDEDDPEFTSTALNGNFWRVSLDKVRDYFAEQNRLTGARGALSDRLQLLGELPNAVAIVLALLPSISTSVAWLDSLPSLASRNFRAFFVFCPSVAVPPAAARYLESLGIRSFQLDRSNPTKLTLPAPAHYQRDQPGDQPARLSHSEDYRSVVLRNQSYVLTESQAKVIEILHVAYLRGLPDVPWESIASQLPTAPARMRDTFRSVDRWNALVLSKKRGTYRLNIQSENNPLRSP